MTKDRLHILIDCDGPIFDIHRVWHDKFRHVTPDKTLYMNDIDWNTWIDYVGKERFYGEFLKKSIVRKAPFTHDAVKFIRKLQKLPVDITIVSYITEDIRPARTARLREKFPDLPIDYETPRYHMRDADILIDDRWLFISRFATIGRDRLALVWTAPWNVDYRCIVHPEDGPRIFPNTYQMIYERNNKIKFTWGWADIYNIINDKLYKE